MKPTKYSTLRHIESAGLNTPKILLIKANNRQEIQSFIASFDHQQLFIIRSVQACEDLVERSYAGYFWSSTGVLGNKVGETISLAEEKNKAILQTLGLDEAPQLMLQTFIRHSVGGVLFSPWSFFSAYSLVEYSTKSVQQAVEGHTQAALISSDQQYNAPLALPLSLSYLTPLLQAIIQPLHTCFSFPFDCEWVYCQELKQIVILQVRPQTHLVGPLLSLKPSIIKSTLLPKGQWYYSALSESLGRLSPLSFSLLQSLYEQAKPALQSLGYHAKQVDFMQRLPDGSVLTNHQYEQLFYSSTPMGGFWRGFRMPKWKQKVICFMQNWSADAVFSSLTLHQAFQFWIVANCLSQGQGRNQRPNIHAYELLWYSVQKKPILNTDKASWNDLNRELRSLFFYELEKLKQSLRQTPEQMFNHWGEQATQLTLLKRQHQQAHLALYDYSQYGNNSNKIQSLGGQKKISGVVFKVDKPSCFYQPIPHQCILVAPYFSNEWIVSIQYIKAIIVEQGGQLSHSAIVARELGIPYLVVKQGTLSQFKHNESLMVDSMTYQITHYKTSD